MTSQDPDHTIPIRTPLKARIVRNELNGEYTIQFQKYGNKHRGFTLPISKEQIEKIKWWY